MIPPSAPRASWGHRAAFGARLSLTVLKRFRFTLFMVALLFGLIPWCYVWRYPGENGQPITFGLALHQVYFLLFGQPSLKYVSDFWLEALTLLIPPLGLATVVDGVVRFAYLFNARARADREWIEVISESMRGHVIVCGAGRVGYRVSVQLRALGREVVAVEKRADAPFAAVLRDLGVPVLVDDIRTPQALARVNVKGAEAVVCATDDDLTNMNVALDARKENSTIRVVMRLFDDDLVEKVRDTFKAEAHSTSALAAPALALAALDPRIIHSFHVGTHLMVVSRFKVGEKLKPLTLSQVRDTHGGLTLSMHRHGTETVHPEGKTPLEAGDELVVQCRYEEYLALRSFTGEAQPPLTLRS